MNWIKKIIGFFQQVQEEVHIAAEGINYLLGRLRQFEEKFNTLIEVLQRLERNLDEKSKSKPSVTIEQKGAAFIVDALAKLPNYRDGMFHLHLDSRYWVCGKEDFLKIVKWDWTNEKRYIQNQYDCENFAFYFKASVNRHFGLNNVGFVLDTSSAHAYNIVVFSNGTAEIFEPQNDSWPRIGQRIYKFKEGKILL